jgi:hypothetical protein
MGGGQHEAQQQVRGRGSKQGFQDCDVLMVWDGGGGMGGRGGMVDDGWGVRQGAAARCGGTPTLAHYSIQRKLCVFGACRVCVGASV